MIGPLCPAIPETKYTRTPSPRFPNVLRTAGRVTAIGGMVATLLLGSVVAANAAHSGKGKKGTPPVVPLTTGTLYAVGVSHPGGGVWIGHHLWITDRYADMCKLDVPKVPAAVLRTEVVCDAARHEAGQPAYDPKHHTIYVPDGRSASPGAWRILYYSTRDTITVGTGYYNVSVDTVLLAPGKLSGLRTTSIALGPDGHLYVGSLMTGDVKRIKNAAGKKQTVSTIGSAAGVRTVFGLAFIGHDLYLAELGGLSVIRNATACKGSCKATLVRGVAAAATTAVAAQGKNTLYFTQAAGTASTASGAAAPAARTSNAKNAQVKRLTLSTGKIDLYANAGTVTTAQLRGTGTTSWAANCTATTCPFTTASGRSSGLTVDPLGNLYVGDDAFNGSTRNTGRIWVVPRP